MTTGKYQEELLMLFEAVVSILVTIIILCAAVGTGLTNNKNEIDLSED